MITAEVDVSAKAFLSNCTFYLYIRLRGNRKELYLSTKASEEIARIVNQHAANIRARPYGYEAEIPETVALAVQYVAYSQAPPPAEEIDEIVKTGTTRIHGFLTGIGFEEYANPNPLEGLPQKPLSRGDCEIGAVHGVSECLRRSHSHAQSTLLCKAGTELGHELGLLHIDIIDRYLASCQTLSNDYVAEGADEISAPSAKTDYFFTWHINFSS